MGAFAFFVSEANSLLLGETVLIPEFSLPLNQIMAGCWNEQDSRALSGMQNGRVFAAHESQRLPQRSRQNTLNDRERAALRLTGLLALIKDPQFRDRAKVNGRLEHPSQVDYSHAQAR